MRAIPILCAAFVGCLSVACGNDGGDSDGVNGPPPPTSTQGAVTGPAADGNAQTGSVAGSATGTAAAADTASGAADTSSPANAKHHDDADDEDENDDDQGEDGPSQHTPEHGEALPAIPAEHER